VSIVRQHNKIGCIPSCELCRKAKTSEISTTHGDSKGWLYSRWNGIKSRCYDTNNINYENYGGRGITLSEEFKDYAKFSEYMRALDNYSEHNTIDRIDPNGNYERGNLRWATHKQQSQNRQFKKTESGLPVGVSYRKNGFYRAQWIDRDGKKKEKSFSVKCFGEELSRFLAEEYRSLMIERLNSFGEFYTEFHGKFKENTNE